MAGAAFARGEAYWRDGHVVSIAVRSDAIDGVVMGGQRYHVRLSVSGGLLSTSCTCPVGSLMCKHAVAVGLAYLHEEAVRRAQPMLPMTHGTPTAQGMPATHGVTAAEGGGGAVSEIGFAERQDLEAWAAEHEVKHALWVSAESLIPRLPTEDVQRYGLRYLLARLAVRDVGSRDSVRRMIGVRSLEGPIAEAALHMLQDAAAVVRVGLEEERARPGERASDPEQVAALWSRLIDARRALREHAAPRSRAARASGTWRFEAAAGAVVWKESERVVRGPLDHGTAAIATRLTIPNGGAARLECTCAAAEGRCTHGIALIDATLDVLEEPGRAEEGRALAEELLRPGWARLFQELDRLEDKAAKPRAAIEVWWRIDRELGAVTLSPIVKKQLRGGGMSSGSKPTVARLMEEHRDQLSEVDARIAEHVMAWAPHGRGSWATSRSVTYPVRAFAALVGHPRVIAEWSDEPIEVARVPLGFAARVVADQVCLEARLAGMRCERGRLGELLEGFAPGEPLVIEEPERGRCLLVDVSDEARRLWSLLGKHGDVFPPESHGALLDRLARLEGRLPLEVPGALKGKLLASEATTVARLRLLPDVTLELELGVRPGDGAPVFQPGSGPRDVLLLRGGERGYVRRALTDEPAQARAALEGLPMEGAEEGPPFCYRIADPDRALALVSALQVPRPGFEV
jgi:hypothetical protein